jgi:hypothetical protein
MGTQLHSYHHVWSSTYKASKKCQTINVTFFNKVMTLHFVGQMYKSKYFMEEQMTKYEMRLDTNKAWDPTLDHFSKLFAQCKAYGNNCTANSGSESAATM